MTHKYTAQYICAQHSIISVYSPCIRIHHISVYYMHQCTAQYISVQPMHQNTPYISVLQASLHCIVHQCTTYSTLPSTVGCRACITRVTQSNFPWKTIAVAQFTSESIRFPRLSRRETSHWLCSGQLGTQPLNP